MKLSAEYVHRRVVEKKARAAEPASGETVTERWAKSFDVPPPPTQGEEDVVGDVIRPWMCSPDDFYECHAAVTAALRQRADEATRAENEACAKLQIGSGTPATNESASVFASGFRCALDMYAAAIRARIKP